MPKNEFEKINKSLGEIKDYLKEVPTRKEVQGIVDNAVDNLALMVAKGFAENTTQHMAMNSRIGNVQSELYDVHSKVDGLSNQAIRYDNELKR